MQDRPPLTALVERQLDRDETELPAFDRIALRVYREAREGRLNAAELCALLQEDPALVADVMRMANSSFFAGLVEIRDLQHAAVRLGGRQIAAIALSAGHRRMYGASKGLFGSRLVALWRHTSTASVAARWLALRVGHRDLADDIFVAALLHDVGKLSLLCVIEDMVLAGLARPNETAVDETLAALHCEHGAALLERWRLPTVFASVVRHQGKARFALSDVMLCIVRLVDRACALEGVSDRPDASVTLATLPETRALQLSEDDLAELRGVIAVQGGAVQGGEGRRAA